VLGEGFLDQLSAPRS